jgi:hypothetical protein
MGEYTAKGVIFSRGRRPNPSGSEVGHSTMEGSAYRQLWPRFQDAVRWAEEIMREIDRRWPLKS